jgi:hypothetical protein
VRAAGDGDLRLVEAETVGRAARQEWDYLKGLPRRAKVGDCLGFARVGYETAVAVHGRDVPAVARLDDAAAPDLYERCGVRCGLVLGCSCHVRRV